MCMRDSLSHIEENKLSESEQARKDLITLRSRPLQISHTELDDLTQLLGKLEKTENALRTQSSKETRSQIRADWQAVISGKSDQVDVKGEDTKDTYTKELRLVSELRVQLVLNLRLAVERSPGAMRRLKEIVANYYADQIVDKHHLTSYTQVECKKQLDLEPHTHTTSGKIRALDIVLVADLDKRGLNTGYLGVHAASKNVTTLLAKLLANGTIDHVSKAHPLMKSNGEGGYTKDQLQTILTKLQAYSAAEKA